MTYRIKITDNMKLFRAAHEAIPIPKGIHPRPAEYVKSAWKERYDVDVVYENERAAYLDFRDEKHHTWFVLSVM